MDGLACLYDLVKAHSGFRIAHVDAGLSAREVTQVAKEARKPSDRIQSEHTSVNGEIIVEGARVLRRWFARAWPKGGSVYKPPQNPSSSRKHNNVFRKLSGLSTT